MGRWDCLEWGSGWVCSAFLKASSIFDVMAGISLNETWPFSGWKSPLRGVQPLGFQWFNIMLVTKKHKLGYEMRFCFMEVFIL